MHLKIIMFDLLTLAKYPFLNDAKLYVKNEGATIKELLYDDLFEPARTIAIERINNSFKNKDVGNRGLVSESAKLMELFSYPVARMIAVCINDSFFTRRYALSEAVHMYKNLQKESLSFIMAIADELSLDIKQIEDESNLSIYFTQYLRFAPTRYKTWKMINRTVNHGYVQVSKKDLARIFQEILRLRINSELEGRVCNSGVNDVFSSDIIKIKNEMIKIHKKHESAPIGKLSISDLPPCLLNILRSVQSGENVPHMGRFALVAFLNSLKLSIDDILKLFSTSPDYEEDKTRYQIEHILGKTGVTSYKAPGCEKLKTFGLCPSEEMDEICKKVYHPMNYYSIKWKKKKDKNKK